MNGKIAARFNGELLPGAFSIAGPNQWGSSPTEKKKSNQANLKFSFPINNGPIYRLNIPSLRQWPAP